MLIFSLLFTVEPLRSLHGQESIGSVNCVILIDGLCDSELHRPDQGDTIGKSNF